MAGGVFDTFPGGTMPLDARRCMKPCCDWLDDERRVAVAVIGELRAMGSRPGTIEVKRLAGRDMPQVVHVRRQVVALPGPPY